MLRRESQGPSKTEGEDQALGEASRQPAAEPRNEDGKIRECNQEQSSRAAVQTGRPDMTPGSGPHGQEGIHPLGSASWWPGPRAGLTLARLEAGTGPERSRLPWPLDALPVASTCPCADAADAAHLPLPSVARAHSGLAKPGRGWARRPGPRAPSPQTRLQSILPSSRRERLLSLTTRAGHA